MLRGKRQTDGQPAARTTAPAAYRLRMRVLDWSDSNRQQGSRMQVIFVQVKCEPGKAYGVATAIMDDVEEVGELYSTSGHYDLLVKFHLGDDTDIGHFVTERVQTVPGVRDTFTTITFKAF